MSPTAMRALSRPALRRLPLIVLAVLCILAGGAVALSRPTAASAAPGTPYSGLVHQLLARLNATRATNGAPPVSLNTDLTGAAVSHSRLMAQNRRYAVRFASEPSLTPQVRSYGYFPRNVQQTLASAKTPHSLRKRPRQLATGSSTLLGTGFTDIGITATSDIADGMHSAIIRATKPTRHPRDERTVPLGA